MSRKFHVTSLDIFDTLMAKGRKVGTAGLLNFAKQKCILISKDDEKAKLSDYVSQLPFDYDDIVRLYEIIESDNRREKLSTSTIKRKVTYNQIQESIESISNAILNIGEKVNIITNPNTPVLMIDYEYKEVDFGKATMLQETLKRDRIEFNLSKSENKNTYIRYYANPKCKELIDKIIQEIEKKENERLELDEIELSHISDGKKRNEFFFSLINGIPGLQLDDVSGVKISKKDVSEEIDIDDIDQESEEVVATEKIAGFIKEVAIKGKALLGQKEYLDFVEKGFFISNLVWKSVDRTAEPNLLVEFEAGFSEPQECKEFEYIVKGAYTYKKNENSFSNTRKPLSEPDKLKYKAKIEEAARKSKQEVSHDKT